MKLQEYTADAICRVMLLPGFIENSWSQSELTFLRIVLTPSFHPEVCLTLTGGKDRTVISVAALVVQFWCQPTPASIPREFEQGTCDQNVFTEVEKLFDAAELERLQERKSICLDGMGVEACLISKGILRRFEDNVLSNQGARELVRRAIADAHSGCCNPQIRNALAHCAWYLDEEYALEEIPTKKQARKLAILGTPTEKEEYFEMLRRTRACLSKVASPDPE